MEDFLKELTLLTQKYNIGIGGCGCCGSPFLYNLSTDEVFKDYLNLTYENGNYITDDEE